MNEIQLNTIDSYVYCWDISRHLHNKTFGLSFMKFENVIVFGLGAVGSNVLLNLIRDLPDLNYTCIDYDKVEERNYRVGTQPYLKQHLGKYKTQAMQMICMMNANKKIEIVNKKIEDFEDVLGIINVSSPKKSPLIIDAFDKAQYRNLLGIVNKNFKIPVIHVGFSPLKTGSVIWDDMWSDISDTKNKVDICTMEGVRSFIMSLTSIASMSILEYYYNDKKVNLYFDDYFMLKKML